MQINRLNWEECKTFAENMPGLEHTELRELENLSKTDYPSTLFKDSQNTSGIVISSKIEDDGTLRVYKKPNYCHVLGIGSSGSGKSQGYILNCLMNATGKESYIVADPKGELSRASYSRLVERYGKNNVNILNFLSPDHSSIRVNEFEGHAKRWIKAVKANDEAAKDIVYSDIRKYVETIFPVRDEEAKDTSWYTTGRQFILAIIMALFEDLTLPATEKRRKRVLPEQITWENIIRIFHAFSWNQSGFRSGFDDHGFIRSRPKDSIAYSLAKTIISNANNTMANYLGFSEMYLRMVSDPKILKISSGNNFDVLNLGNKPQVLFLVYDLSDLSLREYVNQTCAAFVNKLLEHTHQTGEALKTPVILLLDEFPTLKSNPVYPNVLATGRGSKIFLHIICQSITQLKSRYPNEWQAMIENCDLTLFQGTNDVSTAEYFAKELGNTAMPDPSAFLQNSFSIITVPVVTIDKLMHRLSPGEVYIKVHHQQPIHGEFSYYYKTNEYKAYPYTDINTFEYSGKPAKEYDISFMNDEYEEDDDDDDDIFS